VLYVSPGNMIWRIKLVCPLCNDDIRPPGSAPEFTALFANTASYLCSPCRIVFKSIYDRTVILRFPTTDDFIMKNLSGTGMSCFYCPTFAAPNQQKYGKKCCHLCYNTFTAVHYRQIINSGAVFPQDFYKIIGMTRTNLTHRTGLSTCG
jgi:hypothetical protein